MNVQWPVETVDGLVQVQLLKGLVTVCPTVPGEYVSRLESLRVKLLDPWIVAVVGAKSALEQALVDRHARGGPSQITGLEDTVNDLTRLVTSERGMQVCSQLNSTACCLCFMMACDATGLRGVVHQLCGAAGIIPTTSLP